MSLLPPKADIEATQTDVCFVPIADMWPSLFDHLASAREHSGRHGEAEGFCRLEVDRKLVLGRRLYRQLGWLLALEDAIDVAGRLSVLVDKILAATALNRRPREPAWSARKSCCISPSFSRLADKARVARSRSRRPRALA
jgi:hypothetical protein